MPTYGNSWKPPTSHTNVSAHVVRDMCMLLFLKGNLRPRRGRMSQRCLILSWLPLLYQYLNQLLISWRILPISTVNYSTLRAFSIYKTNININIIRPPHYSYPIATSVTVRDPLQGEHTYCHRPLNRALIPTLSHPKSGM